MNTSNKIKTNVISWSLHIDMWYVVYQITDWATINRAFVLWKGFSACFWTTL